MVQVFRTKRGLTDALGYGLKYLWGTSDAQDVVWLTAVCNDLHASETQIVHAADQQLTYLRTLDEMTQQNTRDTTDLARVLRD